MLESEIDVTFKQGCVGELLDSSLGLVISLPPVRRGYFFTLRRRILYWKMQRFAFRLSAIFSRHVALATKKGHSNSTNCCACHEKSPCSGGGWCGDVVWVRCGEVCEMYWARCGDVKWDVVRCDVVRCGGAETSKTRSFSTNRPLIMRVHNVCTIHMMCSSLGESTSSICIYTTPIWSR